tara:strand:- start:166 stop:2181 length:2016 start_codon:yes stop_codon:yes gene_type:complete
MEKKSYAFHKDYCLIHKISNRQEWRAAAKKSNFPKSLYKNAEKSFADRGDWISSADFYYSKKLESNIDKFNSLELNFKQLFTAEKQYNEIKLKDFDELIYTYLMIDSFVYERKGNVSSLNTKLLSMYEKKYYLPCPINIQDDEVKKNKPSKISKVFSSNPYKNLILKNKKLLNAEREFLFYSKLKLNFDHYHCHRMLTKFNNTLVLIDTANHGMDNHNLRELMNHFVCKINILEEDDDFWRYIDKVDLKFYRKNPDPKKIITKDPFNIFRELITKTIESNENLDSFNRFGTVKIATMIERSIHENYLNAGKKFEEEINNLLNIKDNIKAEILLYYTGYLLSIAEKNDRDKYNFLGVPRRFFSSADSRRNEKASFEIHKFLNQEISFEDQDIIDSIKTDALFNRSQTKFERNCYRIIEEFEKRNIPYHFLINDLYYNYLIKPAKSYFYKNIPNLLEKKLSLIEKSRLKDIAVLFWASKGGFYKKTNIDQFNPNHSEMRNLKWIENDIALDENNQLFFNFNEDGFEYKFGKIDKYLNVDSELKSIESINNNEIYQIDKNLLKFKTKKKKSLVKSFKINDQSMAPYLDNGDTVIVDPQLEEKLVLSIEDLDSGKHYLIKKDSNYFARKVIIHEALKKNYILLKSTNADWPDTEVEFTEIEIIGRIMQVIKTVDT